MQRVTHCYNPPGFQDDGPTIATYQLERFDVATWVDKTNKSKEEDQRSSIALRPWVRGPLTGKWQIGALEYCLSGLGRKAETYRWREWVKSDSCYFLFQPTKHYGTQAESGYSDVCVLVLDAKSWRMYWVAKYV